MEDKVFIIPLQFKQLQEQSLKLLECYLGERFLTSHCQAVPVL